MVRGTFACRRGRTVWGYLCPMSASPSVLGDEMYWLTTDRDVVTVGRAEDSNIRLSVAGVSRRHLRIGVEGQGEEGEPGTAWIEDTSSNGTLISSCSGGGEKKTFLLRRQKVRLETGDEIVLSRGKDGNAVVGFKFTRLVGVEELVVTEEDDNRLGLPSGSKRSSTAVTSSSGSDPPPPGAKRIKREAADSDSDDDVVVDDILVRHRAPSPAAVVTIDDDDADADDVIFEPFVSNPNESFEDRLRRQMITAETGNKVKDEDAGPSTSAESSKEEGAAASAIESIAGTMACSICMELLHDPVTSTSCLHSFCGGCLSKWIFQVTDSGRFVELRNQCPKCRAVITCAVKNTELGSVVADVLKVKSHQKRPDPDLEELDRQNKFTGSLSFDIQSMHRAMLRPPAAGGGGRTPRRGGRGGGRAPRSGGSRRRRGGAWMTALHVANVFGFDFG